MEERVGAFWHRLVTRAARRDHPEAVVTLPEVNRVVAVLFRALGGDRGVRIEAGTAQHHGARRGLLQKLAGSGERAELCWRDADSFRLPGEVALLPTRALNRDLYLWLAALAAAPEPGPGTWIVRNQVLTASVLLAYPGMVARYRRLVAAVLETRPDPGRLPAADAAVERTVQLALREPGSVRALPASRRPPLPVPLWLYPPAQGAVDDAREDGAEPGGSGGKRDGDTRRRMAERVSMPRGRGGLILNRFEVLLSLADFIKVDRSTEDDEDENAADAADDLARLSIARDSAPTASRVRFDLDLPSAEHDDTVIIDGIPMPEWDHRKARLLSDHCNLQLMEARDAEPCGLPPRLRQPAKRLRRLFELLVAAPHWQRGQQDGEELDLDGCLRQGTDRMLGRRDAEAGLYRARVRNDRDLSCVLLADLSLSTDAHLNDDSRVIDVVRDTLFLFGETLAATGDRFAMYGFSSRRRQHVRLHALKRFDEAYDDRVRGRVAVVRPGYYTRMGAAVRYATKVLEAEPTSRRLLLLITDGKPNDLDLYEGRYGIEDTRHAIQEARRAGLRPFCVTIDEAGGDYLPHLFGSSGYALIRNPLELPRTLPRWYARLTL
ncbi:MAG: VWA domain-containing protein [Gammaproteobacteria bacterium]|nr:VWA domain-containing protein [Gammaproteobacteria bacterium]